jgi:hypothetical protein
MSWRTLLKSSKASNLKYSRNLSLTFSQIIANFDYNTANLASSQLHLGFLDAGTGTGISRKFPGPVPVPSRVPEIDRDREIGKA